MKIIYYTIRFLLNLFNNLANTIAILEKFIKFLIYLSISILCILIGLLNIQLKRNVIFPYITNSEWLIIYGLICIGWILLKEQNKYCKIIKTIFLSSINFLLVFAIINIFTFGLNNNYQSIYTFGMMNFIIYANLLKYCLRIYLK